jgi:hypothetical protein
MMLVVEFGSRRRGDYHFSSDKDLLVLASNWEEIKQETEKRKLQGYSVSAFLLGKASYLVKTGSLFFKHIADEGTLIWGPQHEYQQLISRWRPARSYDDDIAENLDLLEVLDFIPVSHFGFLVTVDILISSVRNILIRKLARYGMYIYSWNEIFQAAQKHGMIKVDDISVFLRARHLKNLYRQGDRQRVTLSFLERLLDGAERACGASLRFGFPGREEIRSLPERFDDGTYKQLRALELMCAEYSFDASLGVQLAWIRQPSYFCANGSNKPLARHSPHD